MIASVAGDAVFLIFVVAVLCPVTLLATGATCVFVRNAFPGNVVPIVALHAVDRFLLGFDSLQPLVA